MSARDFTGMASAAPWERRLERALAELLEDMPRTEWLAMTDALNAQSSGAMYDGMYNKSTTQIKAWLTSLVAARKGAGSGGAGTP